MTRTASQTYTATCDCSKDSLSTQSQEHPTSVEPEALPSESEVSKAAGVELLDADGKAHTFGSLCSTSNAQEKHLFILVRHFFCGMCQDFLRHFASTVTPEYLSSLPQPTKVTVIACGGHELIKNYVGQTHCPYPLYTDPERKLYRILGLTTTLDLGRAKPEYQKGSVLEVSLKSAYSGLLSGRNMMKSGNISQVGGEFLFSGGQITWCHRMQNTRDHSELSKLIEKLKE